MAAGRSDTIVLHISGPDRSGVTAMLTSIVSAEGARLVIATGSVGPFAERVCARIGLAGVEVVGSELEPFLGGWVARRHCYGPEKVLMLRERGIGERWDVAYTDSATDLALLERASRRCLVNATSRAERRVQRQLGEAFESIAWQ